MNLKSISAKFRTVLQRVTMPPKLRRREVLRPDDIWLKFYRESSFDRDSVLELWQEVATCLRIEMGRMRPDDHLVDDLNTQGIIQPLLENLRDAAIDRAARIDHKVDIEAIETLNDYVNAFAPHAVPTTS